MPTNKKPNYLIWLLIILSMVFLILHLEVALRPPRSLMAWFHIDDAYYYFQVARNVVQGKGFTFDGIGRSNGFHPLWMLINLPIFAFAKTNPYIPFRILVMVSASITLLGGLLLFDLLRKLIHVEIALLGMTAWIFFWPIHNLVTQTGMEAGIYGFSILFFLWLIHKFDRSRGIHFFILGLAATLILFSRLDSIFYVMLSGAWLVFHKRPMRSLILMDILTIFITCFTSIILRTGPVESLAFLQGTYVLFIVTVLARLASYYSLGLYQWTGIYSLKSLIARIVGAFAISSVLIIAIMLGLISVGLVVNFPRSALIIEAGLSLPLFALSRIWLRRPNHFDLLEDLSFRNNFRRWMGRGVLFLLPILLFLSIYFLWNLWAFDTPMPISGQIKQWWGTLLTAYGRQHKSIWTVFRFLPLTKEDQQPWFLLNRYFFQPIYSLLGINPFEQQALFLIVKGALLSIYSIVLLNLFSKRWEKTRLILQNLGFLPLLTACLLTPLYYAFVGYLALREWYWVPQVILSLLLILILLDSVLDWLKDKGKLGYVLKYIPYALIVALMIIHAVKLDQRFPEEPTTANSSDYLKITRYLESHTPKGSRIGMTGGGTDAYFIRDRTIINLDGLINSKTYFDLMRAGKANLYLDQIGLDYVLGNSEVLLQSDPYHWFFENRLGKRGYFSGFTLYRYLPGR